MDGIKEIKTVADLKAAFPELTKQIEEAATAAERTRIQDIEEMAMPGTEVMTAEAKFTKPLSASDYAKAAMKQIKNQGAEMLNSLQEDADGSGMNHVAHQHPQDSAEDTIMNAIKTAGKKA